MSGKVEKKVRRQVRKEVVAERARLAEENPNGIAARAERLERMVRDFKAREGRLTVGIIAVLMAYKKNDSLMVNKFLADTLKDYDLLAKCHQVMGGRDLAMKIALAALKKHGAAEAHIRIGADLGADCRQAVERIEKLDPMFLYSFGDDLSVFDVPAEQPPAAAIIPPSVTS